MSTYDIYFMYKAQCYACKNQIINYENEEYEIRYDAQNKKCTLCLKNE